MVAKIYFYDNNDSTRVRIRFNGEKFEKTFKSKKDAEDWASAKKYELEQSFMRKRLGIVDPSISKIDRKKISDAILHHVEMRKKKMEKDDKMTDKVIFKRFYDFIFDQGRDFIDEITCEDMEAYQSELFKSMKASSVNRHFASLGGFFSKCIKRGFIKESPMRSIDPLQIEEVKKVTWTEKEIEQVFSLLPKHLKQYILFIYSTGCRPREATNLTFKEIYFSEGYLKLKSKKGGKLLERSYPIVGDIEQLLTQIKKERHFVKGEDFVFVNTRGNKTKPDILSEKVREIRRKLGLREAITPYKLRHTFITELIAKDIGLPKVQALAGHKRFQTTLGYVDMPEKELKSIVASLDERRRERRGAI
ncbi:MAG: tyrosine-type recombinase/integrase [Bdellovibrio sp.]